MNAADFEFEEQRERPGEEYRPLSLMAMFAFALALLSLTAWSGEWLWLVALAGVIVAVWTLRRIAVSDPPLVGRRLALIALMLSLISTVGGMTNVQVYQRIVDGEARQFAQHWFDLQMAGKTEQALSLVRVVPPITSLAMPDPNAAKSDPKKQALETYLKGREVQWLMAMGRRALVHYYDTESQEHTPSSDTVKQNYAITYDQDGAKTTFFICLTMERIVPSDKNVGIWKITNIAGGAKPQSRQTAMQGS